MKLTYFGHSCFALENAKGVKIVTDPYGEIGYRMPRVRADAVTVSHAHYDHNHVSAVEGAALFDRAGNYSLGGIDFYAVPSFHDNVRGAKRGANLVFVYDIDGICVCHMGDIGMKAETFPFDSLKKVDVLLIPVGGTYTVDAEEAAEYVRRISPSIVIPMHYKTRDLNIAIEGAERFLDALDCPKEYVGGELQLTAEDCGKYRKIMLMERIKEWN